MRQTEFFVILGHFLSSYHPTPLDNPENQNFEKKWKNCLETLSFYTYMCTINEDRMIYGSWNKGVTDRNFVTLGHFLPYHLPDNPEIQNLKLTKNPWRYYHFTHLHHKWQSYDVWFLIYGVRHDRQNFLPFWTVFCPLTTIWTQRFKILKKWKNTWRYHFTKVYHKWQSYDVWFLRNGAQLTDQTFCHLDHFLPF